MRVAIMAATLAIGLAGCANPTMEKIGQEVSTFGQELKVGLIGDGKQPAPGATNPKGAQSASYVYRPIEPAQGAKFKGLFDGPDREAAEQSRVLWPRAAVTFVKFDATQVCWTAKARIWQNAKTSTDETFEVCEAPYLVKDALGQEGTLSTMTLQSLSTYMSHMTALPGTKFTNTGEQRTQGPNPPRDSFRLRLFSNGPFEKPDPLITRLDALMARLGLVSGYFVAGNISPTTLALRPNYDQRLWVVGFDQAAKTASK